MTPKVIATNIRPTQAMLSMMRLRRGISFGTLRALKWKEINVVVVPTKIMPPCKIRPKTVPNWPLPNAA